MRVVQYGVTAGNDDGRSGGQNLHMRDKFTLYLVEVTFPGSLQTFKTQDPDDDVGDALVLVQDDLWRFFMNAANRRVELNLNHFGRRRRAFKGDPPLQNTLRKNTWREND